MSGPDTAQIRDRADINTMADSYLNLQTPKIATLSAINTGGLSPTLVSPVSRSPVASSKKMGYLVVDAKVALPVISKAKIKINKQSFLETTSPLQLGMMNFWIETPEDVLARASSAKEAIDASDTLGSPYEESSMELEMVSRGGPTAGSSPGSLAVDLQSFHESQSQLSELFSRASLRTPPKIRERIWKEEEAKKAAAQAKLAAELAEFNSFAPIDTDNIGSHNTGDSVLSGSGDQLTKKAASHVIDRSQKSPVKAISESTQALLNSHQRASVRGRLTTEDEANVGGIQQRIRERKALMIRQQEAAELEARRRKVLLDADAKLILAGAAAAAKKVRDSLKHNTISTKLKEQGKKAATGQIDKSHPPPEALSKPNSAPTSNSGFISLTDEQKQARINARNASKAAAEVQLKASQERENLKKKKTARKPDSGEGSANYVSTSPTAAFESEDLSRFASPSTLEEMEEDEEDEPDVTARRRVITADSTHVEREKAMRKIMKDNDRVLKEEWPKYFGPAAKAAFTAAFRTAQKDYIGAPNDKDVPEECNTPRRNYLRETTKLNLLPLPMILRKETHPKGVYLAHKGLGDLRMLPIVAVIDQLPAVESVDLCDNRLTDKSLMPLMKKLVNMPTLLYLDLSFNDMDDSSLTIQEFIRSPNCMLHTLLINGSDVDDYECANLCEALVENKSITTLGLANNLIGNDEHMKVTDQNKFLGGDGLAKLLTLNNTITSLDLQYNQLRLTGAVALGKSLRDNKSLKILKLAYNSFGDVGTQWLGYSLKFNKTLEKVDLTSNSLVPKSVCVLANALAHNETLQELILDDNIMGRVGAQAVASAIQRSTQADRKAKLNISFQSCDCFKATPSLFNPSNPGGTWTLDLGEPYGAMIVEECFFLANHRAGCQISSLKYNKADVPLERKLAPAQGSVFNLNTFVEESKKAAAATIKGDFRAAAKSLEAVLGEFRFKMSYKQRVQVLELVQTSWARKGGSKERTEDLHEVFLIEVFSALFKLNDVNNDETMDADEFLKTLSSLGYKEFDRNAALTLMAEHDRDLSGTIDGSEFAMIMVKEFCRTDLPRGIMVDSATKKPWALPADGIAIVDVSFEIDAPSCYDVGSDDGITTLIKGIQSAKTGEQKDILFAQACTSPYFFLTAEQAQLLFDDSKEAGLSKHPIDMIIAIMPQIVNEEQVNRFLDQNLSESGKLSLRVRMGPLYNAFIGLPTGHYFIDFEKTLDTMGAKRLAALSVSESKATRVIGANTSQKGNGSNFRNEMKGAWGKQEPIAVDGQWFANPPERGELRFDYVSTKRPLVGTLPLSAHRLQRLVKKLELHTIIPLQNKLRDLSAERRSKAKPLKGSKKPPHVSQDHKCASGDAAEHAEVRGVGEEPEDEEQDEDLAHEGDADAELLRLIKPTAPLSQALVKEQFYETIASCHHHTDILEEEYMRDVSRLNYNPDPEFRPPTPEVLASGEVPSKRKMPEIYPFAYRKLLELQVMMPSIFLSVAQVVEIIHYFPSEGYLRVQFVTSIFSHIIDIENIGMLFDYVLNADERTEMIHRIGIMNIFDPMSPDREYKLDLRRWDMREFCKILMQLSINEPGENWVKGGEYRWSKYDDPVPGWVLPAPWATKDEFDDPSIKSKDAGPRRYGWLRCTYTSTATGCEANMALRRQLRRKTLAGLKQLL